MSEKAYSLTDCQEMNRIHPDTFEIPTAEEIVAIKIGRIVKLIFNPLDDEHPSERMWVVVNKIDGDQFEGELNNNPFLFPPEVLKCRDTVTFEAKHIASIWTL